MITCKNCALVFDPGRSHKVFCSAECREGWRYREQLRKKGCFLPPEEIETDLEEMHKRNELGWKRCVCRYCLSVKTVPEAFEFCSSGCETLFYGGGPVP